ncbi:MAG TPA: energy transducer TonB [Dongiaceae bacterium]|nr:energy transducer TonB [Dongiaceae bacterium]
MKVHFTGSCPLLRPETLLFLLALILLVPVSPHSLLAQSPGKNARKVVQRVEPEYPYFLKNGHFEGRIVAEATVLANGSVSSVDIKGGNPMFAEYATKALMKWKYAPAPAQTVELVNFNFSVSPR